MERGKIKKEDAAAALLNFVKGRLSQEVRTGISMAPALAGKPMKDYFGNPTDIGKILLDKIIPLSWKDLDKIIKAEGMTRGSFIQLLNFLFGNVRPPQARTAR